jgi:sialidase-1
MNSLFKLLLVSLILHTTVSWLGAQTEPDPATLYAWYRGDTGLQASDTGLVTLWENQAAMGVAANRNLNQISGTPQSVMMYTPGGTANVVRCDGMDGVWATSARFGSISGNRTLVAYCRLTNAEDGYLFDCSTNAMGLTRAQVRDGMWQAGLQPSGGGANPDTETLEATVGEWQAHIFSFERLASSTQVTHTIPGVGSFSYTNNLTGGLGGLILGQNVAASMGLAVDIAEFMVYNRLLEETEIQDVSDYLVAKWGAPEELPPSGCAAVQRNELVPGFGLHGLMDVQVLGPGAFTELTFTLDGTTDLGDIASLQVYYTGSASEFRPFAPFGPPIEPAAGALTVAGLQELGSGAQHFWIAVEPRRGAEWGNQIDATLVSVQVGDEVRTPDQGAPPEFLTLGNTYYSTVLRRSGDDGVHTYRIPGIATTDAGTLISVFDLRWNSSGDLPADVDVGCMRSTDNGNTWQWATESMAIMDYDESVPGSMGNGVGDPAILVDRETDTVWVAALWSFGNNGYVGSGAGLDITDTGQYVLTRSDDDGLTWSEPINITAQAKVNPNWGVCFQGPGHGIQLRDGTLLFPSQHTDPGGANARAFFIYSTDHGETWNVSPDVNAVVPPQLNENQMVELNTGQIMISSRVPSGGGGKRAWSTYTPGTTLGNGSWSPIRFDLPDPVCQASFIRYSSTLDGAPRDRLLFANPGSSSARVNMTVRMSEDEGVSWDVARQIDSRPAAYSDLTILADGTVGLLYETGDGNAYQTLTFVRFHMDWLTQADLDTDGDGISDYERINGLDQGADDSAGDLDGDGRTNLFEFRAGTMANDPESVFRVESAALTDQELELIWTTVPGMLYTVEGSSALSGGWVAESGAQQLPSGGARLTHAVPIMDVSSRYLRVVAEK